MTDPIGSEIVSMLGSELRVQVPDHEIDLMESGLLDSLGLVLMVAAIERKFRIVLNLRDLDLDDVRTVATIARRVGREIEAQRPAPIGAGEAN